MAASFRVVWVWTGGQTTAGSAPTLDRAISLLLAAAPRGRLFTAYVKHEGAIVYRLPASAEDRRREFLNRERKA